MDFRRRFTSVDDAIANSVLASIGNTPLVRLRKVVSGVSDNVHIYAKLEGFNPGGSVKDRPALQMVRDAIDDGRFSDGKILMDSTSGNTGIAYALIGSVLGFPVELCMPSNVSTERKRILSSLGARIIYTDPMEGSDGAIMKSRELLKEFPGKYYKPDQYNNPSNPKAHQATAREIFEQSGGEVTHLVASIGTGGTIMGAGAALRALKPDVKVLACEPDNPFHGLEGLKHMESSIVPGIYHEELLDGKLPIETEPAYEMTRRLAREEGIFVGQSAGATALAAIEVARSLDAGFVVAVFADRGDKYMSTRTWEFEENRSGI
jgi:S-sulfo-L-cysteine synthase (O-acetyl-L-serine-dependent)